MAAGAALPYLWEIVSQLPLLTRLVAALPPEMRATLPRHPRRPWLAVFGSTLGTPADFRGAYDLIASGRAFPVVDAVYPLAEASAAHERLERGEQLGKIVLRIPG